MRGERLYPLNELRSVDRNLYEREKAKYKGREAVLDFRIPLIDVLWNDTLHLSTIHPSHLGAAWQEVGLWTPLWERLFFQIPLDRIAGYQSVWFASESFWVNNSPGEAVPLAPPLEEFRLFAPTAYEELTEALGRATTTSFQIELLSRRKQTRQQARPSSARCMSARRS
jgi:hypothetical protein